MSIDLDIAAGYRQHAEELRVVAADASSAAIRAIWLVIAADYEQMADSLEATDRTRVGWQTKGADPPIDPPSGPR